MVQPLWRTVWRLLKKLKIELRYATAIPLLGTIPEKKKKNTRKQKYQEWGPFLFSAGFQHPEQHLADTQVGN